MRKAVITTILFIFCAAVANAQENTANRVIPAWGLKAEANLSGFIIPELPSGVNIYGAGATGGGFIKLDITEHFAVQGEMLFHYKSSTFDYESHSGKFEYLGIEIPMYAMLTFQVYSNDKMYLGFGPYSEFGFSATSNDGSGKIDLYRKDDETELSAMSDFNSGFGIMLGYEFKCGLQINAGYKISVTNILDANRSDLTLLPTAISLGIGYRFGRR